MQQIQFAEYNKSVGNEAHIKAITMKTILVQTSKQFQEEITAVLEPQNVVIKGGTIKAGLDYVILEFQNVADDWQQLVYKHELYGKMTVLNPEIDQEHWSEMSHKEADRKFKKWCNEQKALLPALVTKFYASPYHDYSLHVKLGRVIEGLNNPYFCIYDESGSIINDRMTIISKQIVLEIMTEELFEYINAL